MSEPCEAQRGLERLLDRSLRELPVRRAPATLESRVLAELARRAALPWWRRSFAHWPQAARAVFVSMCVILVGLAFAAGGWAASGLRSLHAAGVWPMPWAREAVAVMGVAQWLSGELARAIPPDWIYGGLAAGALLYTALFGLGVAAYRALYLDQEMAGEHRS
jgi:hypothetical protein